MKTFKDYFQNPVAKTYSILYFLIMLVAGFSMATYVPFLVSKGMNLWQVNLINSFFMGTIILMEVPTGSFADKFGRHRSISLSFLTIALGLLVYYCANNFLWFIVAEIIVGLGRTFASGALDAWMTDSLIARGEYHLNPQVLRQKSYVKSIAAVIGSLIGSYAGNYDLSFPWLMGIVVSIISLFYSLKVKEVYRNMTDLKKNPSLGEQINLACSHSFRSRHILGFMILGMVLMFSVQAINMQWTILFQNDFHLETKYLGWIFAGIALTQAAGGYISKFIKLPLISDNKQKLALTQILTAILIIIMSQISTLIVFLIIFFIHEITRNVFDPLKESYFNDHLQSKTRATVLSLSSMISKIGCLVGLLFSGWLANSYSIRFAWLLSGIFMLIACLLFFLPQKKEESKNGLL